MSVKLTITLRKLVEPKKDPLAMLTPEARVTALKAMLPPREKAERHRRQYKYYDQPLPYIPDVSCLAALRKLDAAGKVEWQFVKPEEPHKMILGKDGVYR